MEDYGYKYIHKLSQFVTTLNSRKNCSMTKNVNSSDFLSILYSKLLRDYRKPEFMIGNRVRISKYELPFRKGCKQQFTQQVFEIVAIPNQSVAMRHFYEHFSLITSSNFRFQLFIAVSGNLGRKVPVVDDALSSHKQEIYPIPHSIETA